ncbi:MAG: presenilin family intramembrane aspartyl protease [Candidatus Micrarchaeales archaeon]
MLFLIVQFGGLLLASTVFSTAQITLVSTGTASSTGSLSEVLYYFGFILLSAVLLLILIKRYNGDILFTLLEGFMVIVTGFFFFLLLLSYIFPNAPATPLSAASLLLPLALLYAKRKRPSLTNFVVIISSIGFGVVLGITFLSAGFGFVGAFLLMALIAAYDYIAVFITKHMITFAKALSSRNLAFLITASDVEVAPRSVAMKNDSGYKAHLQEIKKLNNPLINKIIKDGDFPIISQVALGAGDLGLPLMVAVAAYTLFLNYFLSVAVIIGGAVGLIVTMAMLKKYQRALPAIPPLFTFISIAIGIALLFTPQSDIFSSLAFVGIGVAVLAIMIITLNNGEQKIGRKQS